MTQQRKDALALLGTVVGSLSGFIALCAVAVSYGQMDEAITRQDRALTSIEATVTPLPARVAELSAHVQGLDARLARVERCLDATRGLTP
jgi:hypothetical protein